MSPLYKSLVGPQSIYHFERKASYVHHSFPHLDLLFPGSQLPLELLHESYETNSLRSGGSVHHVVLKVRAVLKGKDGIREEREKNKKMEGRREKYR